MNKEFSLEEILMAERPRLISLCARLSGSKEASEDLAQEVLSAAWRYAHRLRQPEQYAPWLSSIARNVCLHWSRRHYSEQSRIIPQQPTQSPPYTGDITHTLRDDFDLEVELERQELAGLLDRALALLPADTRTALIEHYIEGSPHVEIAAQLGISEGAVAARVHRGKLALRRLLTSTLRHEAAAYFPTGDTGDWAETRIWCTSCGRQRLMVRFAQPSGTPSTEPSVSFRCPVCYPDPEATEYEYRTANAAFKQLIGGLTSPRSILNRTAAWAHDYYVRALEDGEAPCSNCGSSVQPRRLDSGDAPGDLRKPDRIYVLCERCGEALSTSLDGLVVSLPQVQQFWRKHSRIRTLPGREIEAAGQKCHVMSLESIANTARIDVVCAGATFQLVAIHGDLVQDTAR